MLPRPPCLDGVTVDESDDGDLLEDGFESDASSSSDSEDSIDFGLSPSADSDNEGDE